jgi:type I site-specific restriction-modification system R (restriction) subunit
MVHPRLSERADIIVITDEAHRSQYDTLAMNMRTALPNALFIAFTGTPLMAGEERTRQVFGDYVSIYNFQQAVEDRATVPLHHDLPEKYSDALYRQKCTSVFQHLFEKYAGEGESVYSDVA